jgi:CRP/FNR family transcriptional regulator
MTKPRPQPLPVNCSNCSLRALCVPEGLNADLLTRLDGLVQTRRVVTRGAALFHSGDAFDSVYAIRTGFFKVRVLSEGGREQITGFKLSGDLLGMSGVCANTHTADAIALEDSQVCVIPFAELERLARDFPRLQHHVHRLMSREIVLSQGAMLLSNLSADERVASFLVDLTRRLQLRGFSPSSLVLRMTREEIGTYLGLRLETVSRCLSRLQAEGVLQVRDRQVNVLDAARLQQAACGPVTAAAA